jgi:hypothetical protein
MKQYTFIDARNDKFGNHQVLWSHGNYTYEIEDRTAGTKLRFIGNYEDALKLFREVCEGY